MVATDQQNRKRKESRLKAVVTENYRVPGRRHMGYSYRYFAKVRLSIKASE